MLSLPGLLHREHEAAVVYGSIDTGKNIKTDEKFSALVSSCSTVDTMYLILLSCLTTITRVLLTMCATFFCVAVKSCRGFSNSYSQVSAAGV